MIMSIKVFIIFLTTLLLITVTACTSQPTPTEIPTVLPTITLTPTPTIIWFPPTPTFTPIPTSVPKPTQDEQRPIERLLLLDVFDQGDLWELGSFPAGKVSLGKNELSLTITKPQGYVSTLRQEPSLSDFYLEVDAYPSLCIGKDQYGLLIRSNTPTSFYRFALSCDGRARVDLISGTNATSPQPWIESASIPSGAPSHVKIGVLSKGEELSLWVNDQYQFTISDKTLHSGRIGFFARSGGDNAVTINFSNLKIYTLANQ